MEIEQKRGEALVIVGKQGSGKSILARQIAAKTGGHCREAGVHELERPFDRGILLADQPDTLIIDGLPKTREVIEMLKGLITSDTVLVDFPGQKSRIVKTPNFIFCSGDRDPLLAGMSDRRFHIVHI
jgi:Holliday junction resolvasome RuvABC ATP-dependent DNA helicase subunit